MFIDTYQIPFFIGPRKLVNMDHVTTIEMREQSIVLLNHGNIVESLRIADEKKEVTFYYLYGLLCTHKKYSVARNQDGDFFLQP